MLRRWSLCLAMRPSEAYAQLVQQGRIRVDANQQAALPHFDRLYDDLTKYVSEVKEGRVPPRLRELEPPRRLGLIPAFFLKRQNIRAVRRALREHELKQSEPHDSKGSSSSKLEQQYTSFHPLSHIKGLYLYGGVGSGKTMLMDLFYEHCPAEVKKARTHFHQFMLDVHKTSHSLRYNTPTSSSSNNNNGASDKKLLTGATTGTAAAPVAATSNTSSGVTTTTNNNSEDVSRIDLIPHDAPRTLLGKDVLHPTEQQRRRSPLAEIDLYTELAERLVGNIELLCFDEVAVSDVADAMILKRLFLAFYRLGLVVVFTSNRAPDELYLGGLNRGDFLPFIALLSHQCCVYRVQDTLDYRLLGHSAETYLCPFSPANEAKLQKLFLECCKGMPPTRRTLKVFGRDVVIPRACDGVCYFYFHEICGADTSSADFQAIAKTFHTIFINGVPQFPYERSDVKTRFLLLIDSLYERNCKLILYADVEPALLQKTRDESVRVLQGAAAATHLLTDFERETGRQLVDESDNSFQMERCISRLCEMRTEEYLKAPHLFEEVSLLD